MTSAISNDYSDADVRVNIDLKALVYDWNTMTWYAYNSAGGLLDINDPHIAHLIRVIEGDDE